ncbi:MAG: hypothetical protein JST54_31950 [Deltaproteobacteria bacterium]|nr:hypothetical protein [Deltaproteobacteria bacterium]
MVARRTALVLALTLLGCVNIPRLSPNPKQGEREDAIVETPNGLVLRAVPNAWHQDPSSVAEHFTPIWINIQNRGEQPYDITFANITLIDEQGRLFAVVPPMEVLRSTVGETDVLGPETRVAEAGMSDVPLLAQFGFGIGPAYDPFDPMNPYGYNPNYTSSADAARNIVQRGLREGRLLPKTQAMGFLYFQRAYDAKELHLRVDAQPEVQGLAPVEMQVNFTVAP